MGGLRLLKPRFPSGMSGYQETEQNEANPRSRCLFRHEATYNYIYFYQHLFTTETLRMLSSRSTEYSIEG